MTAILPDYNDLNEALSLHTSAFHPAEAHGFLCGIICVSQGKAKINWEDTAFGASQSTQVTPLLQQLYAISLKQLSEFELEFTLFLPESSTDINKRSEALGLWCQGFLTGLAQTKKNTIKEASTDVRDTLNDITEIAQVNYGQIDPSEEDETAFFELVEYVRLAVLMIFQELVTKKQTSTLTHKEVLH